MLPVELKQLLGPILILSQELLLLNLVKGLPDLGLIVQIIVCYWHWELKKGFGTF